MATLDLGLLSDETPYRYRLQRQHHKFVLILTRILAGRAGVGIRYGAAVEAVAAFDHGVEVTAGGDRLAADWVIGADGGRSLIRKSQGIDFEGFTHPERFLVVTATYNSAEEGFAVSNYVSDPEEWCAVFEVPGDRPGGLWRTVFPVWEGEEEEDLLSFAQAAKAGRSVRAAAKIL